MEANRIDSVQGESTKGIQEIECTCAKVYIGLFSQGAPDWRPGCKLHGLGTEYYEKVFKPKMDLADMKSAQLRKLKLERRKTG